MSQVDLAFLTIGGNDFGAVAASIANGSLIGPALANWAQGVVNNIDTATDTVLSSKPTGIVVAGLPDMLLTPGGRSLFDTPIEQQRGTTAVDLFNSKLKPEVLSRGQVYVDLASALRDINASPLIVGGVNINTFGANSNPTYFFQDGLHPAAVGNGVIANLMLSAVNLGYGTEYSLLSDLEILTTANLAGSYSGETSSLNYSSYITTSVPEPGSLWFAAAGVLTLLLRRRRRILFARKGVAPEPQHGNIVVLTPRSGQLLLHY